MMESDRIARSKEFTERRSIIAKEWYDKGNVLSGETLPDFQKYMRKREKELKKEAHS